MKNKSTSLPSLNFALLIIASADEVSDTTVMPQETKAGYIKK